MHSTAACSGMDCGQAVLYARCAPLGSHASIRCGGRGSAKLPARQVENMPRKNCEAGPPLLA